MIIQHPDLGPRDSSEFVYKGDAELLFRPERTENADQEIFHDYLYLRNNPAGKHRELWYHEYGDRSWLVVTRDTTCLLYTSPSPRDPKTSRMPSSA